MQSESMSGPSIETLNCRPSLVGPTLESKRECKESKTSLKEKVSSILSSCRICFSSIFNAAALNCGHRFCERCLGQYWQVKKKPDNIVCPLCRCCSFDIAFTKTVETPSTEDFRRTFNPTIIEDEEEEARTVQGILWTIKVIALMPLLYYVVKWLMSYFIPFFKTYYYASIKSNMS